MINFFNRKEILNTVDPAQKARVCEILEANGIDYFTQVVNRGVHGVRYRTGTYGIDMSKLYRYIVYVKRSEAEKAIYLINKR